MPSAAKGKSEILEGSPIPDFLDKEAANIGAKNFRAAVFQEAAKIDIYNKQREAEFTEVEPSSRCLSLEAKFPLDSFQKAVDENLQQ